MSDLLSDLRNYLVSKGIVRRPSVAGPLPALWLEPQGGVPAPGEGKNATEISNLPVGLFLTGGMPTEPYGSYIRKSIVDFQFRSKGSGAPANIAQLEADISLALIDKRGFMMSTLQVIECQQWRALQRLSSDSQGYNYVTAYWFELYRPGYGS